MSVSIVIPTYNRAAAVAELAEAALDEASAVGGEVVVVDDGSTDDTRGRLSGLPLRLFSIPNGGVSAARNFGLQQARHPFIRFLDSDDLPVAGSTSALLGAIGSGEVAAGLCGEMIAGRLVIAPHHGIRPRADLRLSVADVVAGRVPVGAALLRRDKLAEIGGFDAVSRFAEDYDLMMRGWAAGWSGPLVPSIVYHVRDVGGERLSRTPQRVQYEHFAAKMEKNAQRLEGCPGYDAHARKIFGQLLWRNGRDAARAGYEREARSLWTLAEQVAGRGARAGSNSYLFLVRLLGPAAAESLLMTAKRGPGQRLAE